MMTPSDFAKMQRKNQAGQALIVTAVSLVFVLAMIGFGVDIGMLRYDKRLQQTAADAAAIAGADDLAHECLGTGSGCADWSTAAQNASSSLGFTNGTNNVTVTVNNPPLSGPHASGTNADDYVEVIVSAVQPTFFARVIGVNQATVVARAVATYYNGGGGGGGGSSCWWNLGVPAKEIGVDPYGSPTVNANCGVTDNGNYDPRGKALTINTCSFQVSGTDTGNTTGGVYCDGNPQPPTYGNPTAPNPLLYLNSETPCDLGYTCDPTKSPGSPNTSGCTGGATICCPGGATVCSFQSLTINGGTQTFAPGIYVVDGSGGITCQGNPTMSGTGVLFFFTGTASINCQGNVGMNFTAPTSLTGQFKDYNGILMWQDPCDSNTGLQAGGTSTCNPANPNLGVGKCPPSGNGAGPQLSGNDGSSFNGVLYFPSDQLYLTGNSGTVNVDTLVSDTTCVGGNATFDLVGTAGLGGGGTGPLTSTLSNAVLVE